MGLTKISGNVVQVANFSLPGIIAATSVSATNINATGVVTATSFSGDGSGLTGIGVTRSLTIGTRTTSATINAVGTGIRLSLRSGIATVNF